MQPPCFQRLTETQHPLGSPVSPDSLGQSEQRQRKVAAGRLQDSVLACLRAPGLALGLAVTSRDPHTTVTWLPLTSLSLVDTRGCDCLVAAPQRGDNMEGDGRRDMQEEHSLRQSWFQQRSLWEEPLPARACHSAPPGSS